MMPFYRSPPARAAHTRLSGLLVVLLMTGCNAPIQVKSTTYTPLQHQNAIIPEAELLDVGVLTFDPGLDDLDEEEEANILPSIRNAEAHYLATQLTHTIQDSAAWGAVRLLPSAEVITDVYVSGVIKHSDGEKLELDITVKDTTGKAHYTKTYQAVASKYAYERRKKLKRDPFQGLFNQIANDLVEWRQQLSGKQALDIRTISSLRFARDFSPEAFAQHLETDRKGRLSIARLPAENDPILRRLEPLRERDYLYVDTVQEYYDAFSEQMKEPYQTWRSESYDEVMAARQLKRQSIQRTAGGVAAILGLCISGSL